METKPALEASLVQQFVGNAHGNLGRVKVLLVQEPALINAGWDWGGAVTLGPASAPRHTGEGGKYWNTWKMQSAKLANS
jgi:hypothetical protein